MICMNQVLWVNEMTMLYERKNAVLKTEQFLISLCDPKQTLRVPSAVRTEARRLLKHYPTEYYVDQIFGDNE